MRTQNKVGSRPRVALVILILAILFGDLDAQTPLPLAGFRYVSIQPLRMVDGGPDRNGLAPYLEGLLTKAGWSIVSGSEDFADFSGSSEAQRTLSQTILCRLAIDPTGFGTTASLACVDVLGRAVVEISEKGVAVSEGGELKAAVRHVAERLYSMRPRFEPAQTVGILSRLPPVETYLLTEQVLDQMALDGKLTAPIEGLWSATDGSGARLAIVAAVAGREFIAVVLESPRSFLWQPGMVKARFTSAIDDQTFAAKWGMADRTEAAGIASLTDSTLTISVSRAGKEVTIRLLKLRSAGSPSKSLIASSSGTGFFCAPGVVATNAHVIQGATAVELYLPVQRRTLKLEILVSDVSNDLALLRVVGEDLSTMPPSLQIADSDDVRLGVDALVVGFPLADVLGADHKVTAGVVSALDGLAGDPRMLQLTAPIQPGSSGSPMFDRSGRVIGLVTSTLNTLPTIRATGQAPQNVNFAVKSEYLALLLRRVPNNRTLDAARPISISVPEMIERVRVSIGQIRTYR